MSTVEWYQQLIKPEWAPPSSVFGPVWSVLYILIAISFGYVFWQTFQKRMPKSVMLPFAINLMFNAAFSPIQFGLRSNELAAIDIVLVFVTIIWSMKAVWPHAKWIAYIQVPYLLWVSFATVLQLTITYLNW